MQYIDGFRTAAVRLLAIVVAWQFAGAGLAVEPDVKFQELDTGMAVSTMAPTEDGKYLLVAHLAKNKLTVWDIATRRKEAEIDCPSPRFIMSRGQRVFVANFGKGTVTVLAQDKNFKAVNQLDVGSPDVIYISAAGGRYFAGQIIVTVNQSVHRTSAVLIDVDKNSHREIHGDSFVNASVDYEGRYLITQDHKGRVALFYDLRDQLELSRAPGRSDIDNLALYQVRSSPFWFGGAVSHRPGGNLVAQGMPPKLLKDLRGVYIIPDLTQPACYVLEENAIRCLGLNSGFPELGKRTLTAPNELLPRAPGRSRRGARPPAPPVQPAAVAEGIFHNVAVTANGQLQLYVLDAKSATIYYASTSSFSLPQYLAWAEKMPCRIAAGKPFSCNHFGGDGATDLELLNAPPGMALTPAGELKWTPTEQDIGKKSFKIRLTIRDQTLFQPIELEVVDADVAAAAAGDVTKIDGAGKHRLKAGKGQLQYSCDMRNILLLADNKLTVLDGKGLFAQRSQDLPKPYKKILDRPDSYIALAERSVDLLDKKSFQINKSVALADCTTRDLAIHPARRVSYVTVESTNRGKRQGIDAHRVMEIDEVEGRATELVRIFGTWVRIDPTGKYMYLGLMGMFEGEDRVRQANFLFCFDVSGPKPVYVKTNSHAGRHGTDLALAPDGRHVAYISDLGPPDHQAKVPAFSCQNIDQMDALYPFGDKPYSLSFHPILELVAGSNGKQALFFDRKTGGKLDECVEPEPYKAAISPPVSGYDTFVNQVFFTPSGTHVILGVGAHGSEFGELRSVPLKLSESQRARLAQGFKSPSLSPQHRANDNRPSRGAIDALTGRGDQGDVTAREISRQYDRSVVLLGKNDGAGVVVGRHGYILTCAHLLPKVEDPTVTYRMAGESTRIHIARAAVALFDEQHDLALLKIEPKGDLRSVALRTQGGIESGETVVAIGNPVVSESELTNSLITGIVGNARRDVGGESFVQISGAVTSNYQGGPIFNNRGQMIGLVAAQGATEGAAFAVPVEEIVKFLEAGCVTRGEVNSRESAPVPQDKQRPRTWTDVNGKKITATLVELIDGTVVLRKSDGTEIRVPLDRFSNADQDIIKRNQR